MSGYMVFGDPETTSSARGLGPQDERRGRDVIDCGEGKDTVIYTPGVEKKITNCENLNPPEPE